MSGTVLTTQRQADGVVRKLCGWVVPAQALTPDGIDWIERAHPPREWSTLLSFTGLIHWRDRDISIET